MEEVPREDGHIRSSSPEQSVLHAPRTVTPRRSIELVRSGSSTACVSGLLTVSPCQHQPSAKGYLSSAPSVHMSYASATKSSPGPTTLELPNSAPSVPHRKIPAPAHLKISQSLQHDMQQNTQPLASSTSYLRDLSSGQQPSLQQCEKPSIDSLPSKVVLKAIAKEITRKLQLATLVDTKEDHDLIIQEVFVDLTRVLDVNAQSVLNVPPCYYYEILAQHYAEPDSAASALELLRLFQRLWNFCWIAPVYALLLHRWLLQHPDAGGSSFVVKHFNVFVHGIHQLFLNDAHAGVYSCTPLWYFLAHEAIMPGCCGSEPTGSRYVSGVFLDGRSPGVSRMTTEAATVCLLPERTRGGLMAATAAFLPYYSEPGRLQRHLARFPRPDRMKLQSASNRAKQLRAAEGAQSGLAQQQQQQQQQQHSRNSQPPNPSPNSGSSRQRKARASRASSGAPPVSDVGVKRSSVTPEGWLLHDKDGAGADFVMGAISETLSKLRTQEGLIPYLERLKALHGSQHLSALSMTTSHKLRTEIYSLTSSGGPKYAPVLVRNAACDCIDALFPEGKTMRHTVRWLAEASHFSWAVEPSAPFFLWMCGVAQWFIAAWLRIINIPPSLLFFFSSPRKESLSGQRRSSGGLYASANADPNWPSGGVLESTGEDAHCQDSPHVTAGYKQKGWGYVVSWFGGKIVDYVDDRLSDRGSRSHTDPGYPQSDPYQIQSDLHNQGSSGSNSTGGAIPDGIKDGSLKSDRTCASSGGGVRQGQDCVSSGGGASSCIGGSSGGGTAAVDGYTVPQSVAAHLKPKGGWLSTGLDWARGV